MKLPLKLFVIILLAFTIAFAFNFFFMNLSERALIDQIFLVAFSTAALGYLIFSFLGNAAGQGNESVPLAAKKKFNGTAVLSFLRENVYGFVLALIFFAVYTYIGLRLNSPKLDTVDNYLDADNSSWMTRIAAPNGYNFEMRGPHP
jgi:hypothetical protein